MNSERPRFSILHLIEATAVLAIALAVGRAVVADYVSIRDAYANGPLIICFAPPVLPQLLTGGICGAYLGLRWFRHHHLFWRVLESALLGGFVTTASLISLFTVDLPKMPLDILLRPAFLFDKASNLLNLSLWGSIFSGCISLILAGLLKLIAWQLAEFSPNGVSAGSDCKS